VLKTMNRKGDNAEMAIIELVDFNEAMLAAKATKGAAKKTRRGRTKAAEKVVEAAETSETTEAPSAE
jgi:large subunit ribosomal protein L17